MSRFLQPFPGRTQDARRRKWNILDTARDAWGVSLLPLLKNARAPWSRPSVTTYLRGNHSVRSERWRSIRYSDGTEELHDHSNDELEWSNLADKLELRSVKEDLARWLPAHNAPDAPSDGSTPVGED